MLLRTLIALAFLTALAPCQNGEATEEVAPDDQRRTRAGKEERNGKEIKGEEELENLTPEQRLARNIINGASAYCHFTASVKPAKLMPGQSGVLVVAAVLKGAAVIPSPAPMEMVAPLQQGLVTLGPMSFQPAELGKGELAKAYSGLPVYDNYAIFEIPVAMAAEAELGKKQMVRVDMRFDLYDGNSAQPVGRFMDQVATEIEVGRAPDPTVASLPRVGVSSTATAPGKPAQPTSTTEPNRNEAKPAVRALDGAALLPAEVTTPTTEASADPSVESPMGVDDSDSSVPLPLVVGAGVLVLGIILLLARKK